MPEPYDPNCEATNSERVVAAHWELLRRNPEFCSVSTRWVESGEFRLRHALSPNYHDFKNHAPRCAWDWMLTPAQRVELARFQIENLRWFVDPEFNFGPIVTCEKIPPVAVTRENCREFIQVEPLPKAPSPITVLQSWANVPDEFKRQFRLAYRGCKHEFGEVSGRLDEISTALRRVARKLASGDPLTERDIIAKTLFEFGGELHEIAEFCKVFKIPKQGVSEKRFQFILTQIQDSFKLANLLTPTKEYDTRASYLGTAEDWRWFLKAEQLGLDIHKSADATKLAEIYSHDLRQRTLCGQAPRRAKAHGHTGTKFSSRVLKGRRSTVKRHVLSIQRWIDAAYPLHKPEPGRTSS